MLTINLLVVLGTFEMIAFSSLLPTFNDDQLAVFTLKSCPYLGRLIPMDWRCGSYSDLAERFPHIGDGEAEGEVDIRGRGGGGLGGERPHDKVERRTLLVARSCPLALSQGSGHPWTLFF